MKKRPKGLLILLIVLIIISLACGVIGLLESLKESTPAVDNNEPKEYKVAYRYYLDGEEIDEMITQEYTEIPSTEFEGVLDKVAKYQFEKYTCTNNVTGEWNEEAWEFNPNLTANTTCRLYFVKTIHNVTFKANNGKLPSGNEEETAIANQNQIVMNIIPNDGYKFDKITCTNDAEATYNEETKDVTVTNVKKDSVCTISFKINDYTVEVKANNGTVTEDTKSVNYGGNATYIITPAENYRFDSVNCTNNQNATYDNATNTLTISGITNSTVCTVQFKPIKYTVTLVVENGSLLSTSSSPQSVSEGKTVTFGISPDEGFGLTGATLTCDNTQTRIEAQSGTIFIYNVQSDLNCKATLKATEVE